MAENQQIHRTSNNTTVERPKVAGRCCECGAVYSAWILADNTVQSIGKKDGCRCGGANGRGRMSPCGSVYAAKRWSDGTI